MQKFLLTIFLIPMGFSFSPFFLFGFYGDNLRTKVVIASFFILYISGLCIYIKLWINQFKSNKSSSIGLWIAMIFCFSALIGYMTISDRIFKEKKENYIKDHCTETITTKTNSYTLKRCDDGTINGEGYAISEYIMEGGEY